MAERPWVTPAEVKAYTDTPEVASRADSKLAVDISRAEEYVISYTHNDFSDFTVVPSAVKTAVLILSESYARTAVNPSNVKGVKSETFDDYSYTATDSQEYRSDLDLSALLSEYVLEKKKGNFTLRMRKL